MTEKTEKYNRRGKGTRPLLESEIRAAQSIAVSAMDAARKLNVTYITYKKWARHYGVHDFFNQGCKGRPKIHKDPSKGKIPLDDILAGKYPDYPTHLFKKKLVTSEIKQLKCDVCGFEGIRQSDGQSPILVYYKDGNPRNKSLDNIEFLCYNHAFLRNMKTCIRQDRHAKFENADGYQRTIEKQAKRSGLEVTKVPLDININDLTDEEINQLLNK